MKYAFPLKFCSKSQNVKVEKENSETSIEVTSAICNWICVQTSLFFSFFLHNLPLLMRSKLLNCHHSHSNGTNAVNDSNGINPFEAKNANQSHVIIVNIKEKKSTRTIITFSKA